MAESRHRASAAARELRPDLAGLVARIDAVGSALEHVLDVLETIAQSRDHIDWHVEQARRDLSRLR